MPRISSVRRIRQMEFFMYTYDIEQLLKNGSAVKLKPQGYSMYPLFLPGRDEAVIEHCVPSELHRGDVILYRRVQGNPCSAPHLPNYQGWLLSGRGQSDRSGRTSFPGADSWKTDWCRTQWKIVFCFVSNLSDAFFHLALFTPCPPVFLVGNGFFPQVFSEALIFSLSSPNFFQNAQRNFYCIRLFAFPSPWLQCSEVSSLFQRSPDPAAAESQYTGESRRRTEAYRLLRISVVRFSASAELRPL